MCHIFRFWQWIKNTKEKKKYDQLADKWGDDKFDYLLGSEILEEMEPIDALKELVLDEWEE